MAFTEGGSNAQKDMGQVPESPESGMTFPQYLQRIGIADRVGDLEGRELSRLVDKTFNTPIPELGDGRVIKLYSYDIPVEENGLCMYPKVRQAQPYNLATTLGLNPNLRWGNTSLKELRKNPNTARLWNLSVITNTLGYSTDTEWVGIYRAVTNPSGERVLVKEAYVGSMSKPEFALTEKNALVSNNSKVGLSGKAVIMDDVLGTLQMDPNTPYYSCDPNVESEFCLPIFGKSGDIIGIIDAEAWVKNHFDSGKLLQIAKVAYDLGQINLGIE